MPIPLWTIPETKEILGRPRREPLYDSEGDKSATAIPAKLTFFQLLATFQVTSLSQTSKVAGRDTNMQDAGRLSKGEFFHWYAWTVPVSVRNNINLATGTNDPIFGEIINCRESRGVVFRFSQTPYIIAQLDEIPTGTGVNYINSTKTAVNVFPIMVGRNRRENRYDVTLNGFPTEITDREKFNIDFVADSAYTPSPSQELWWMPHLWGTHVVGLRG